MHNDDNNYLPAHMSYQVKDGNNWACMSFSKPKLKQKNRKACQMTEITMLQMTFLVHKGFLKRKMKNEEDTGNLKGFIYFISAVLFIKLNR